LFAKAMSEVGVDNSEHLLRAMDKHGVTHAIIQTAPGKGTNRMVLDAAEKSGGRSSRSTGPKPCRPQPPRAILERARVKTMPGLSVK
jgi:hypothetical protein